jgi:cell division transport system permease protein
MWRRRLDLPLDQTAPGRLLPWLIGGMIYGTVVMLGVAMTADRVVRAHDQRAQLVTVTLPLTEAADGAGDIAAALEALRDTPGVLAATPVPGEELRALMKPWLGEARGDVDLPLPRLIDVTLDPLATPDLPVLENRLREAVSGATIGVEAVAIDHAERMAALVRGWTGAAGLVVLLAALLGIRATTRLSLRLNADSVELLRWMGASNRYLADQLEGHALSGGLPAAATGFGFAIVTVSALLYTSKSMEIAAPVEIGLRPLDWLLLACLAALSLLLVVAVVRITALGQLQNRPA